MCYFGQSFPTVKEEDLDSYNSYWEPCCARSTLSYALLLLWRASLENSKGIHNRIFITYIVVHTHKLYFKFCYISFLMERNSQ